MSLVAKGLESHRFQDFLSFAKAYRTPEPIAAALEAERRSEIAVHLRLDRDSVLSRQGNYVHNGHETPQR